MDCVNLLPTPPQFFGLFMELAMSLYRSTIAGRHSTLTDRPSLKDFDVDIETGFFPSTPLPKLSHPFDIWEQALSNAAGRLSLGDDMSDDGIAKREFGIHWRSQFNSWPVLDVEPLQSDLRQLQRAHYVLAWLVHLYVHSIPLEEAGEHSSDIVVPKTLAIPLVQVSEYLRLAPVLTFADTVLWNYELIDPNQPLSMHNMRFVNLFSGTEDEANFYLASARAELRGVEMLRIFDDYDRLPSVADFATIGKVARDLTRLAGIIGEINDIIESVRPTCEPHVFYHKIRPWFNGSGSDGPNWRYEGIDAKAQQKMPLSGPSAGQSSVMHALDIFLDVDHKLRQRRSPAPSAENKRADLQFMERMRLYMPGRHQDYLKHLGSAARPVRELAKSEPILRDPFNACVAALRQLRTEHIRIACRYIVNMAHSRSIPAGCPVASMLERIEKNSALGTGGNPVAVLLKHGRDATTRTALPSRG